MHMSPYKFYLHLIIVGLENEQIVIPMLKFDTYDNILLKFEPLQPSKVCKMDTKPKLGICFSCMQFDVVYQLHLSILQTPKLDMVIFKIALNITITFC